MAYTLAYMILEINPIQQKLAKKATSYIEDWLGSEVEIEKVKFSPFNEITLNNFIIYDEKHDTLIYAKRANASIKLLELLNNKIVLNTVSIDNLFLNLSKEFRDGDLNAKFLIDKFNRKKRSKSIPSFSINTLLLQNGTIKYNQLDAPDKEPDVFDKYHVSIDNFLVNASLKSVGLDSVNINVRSLKVAEKSGFNIKNLTFKLIGNSSNIRLRNLIFNGNKSQLSIKENNISMDENLEWSDFMESADVNFAIDNGAIVLSDFAPFVPKFKNFNNPITIDCAITGNPNHLILNTLDINYNKGGITASGYGSVDNLFPDIHNAFLYGKMEKLNISSNGAISLMADLGIELKNYTPIKNLQSLSFNGEISGFPSNIVTFGEFRSPSGNIKADLSLESDNGLKFKGKVKSNKLDINSIFPDKGLGVVSFNLNLDGIHSKYYKRGIVKGDIGEFSYNEYSYKNIAIDGNYKNNEYNGSLSLNDSNIVLDVEGMMNLDKRNREFALKLIGENISLNNINLSQKYDGALLNFDIDANFKGDRIDNADGAVVINKFSFNNNGLEFKMDSAYIKANNSSAPQYIKIHSPVIFGEITGEYKFSELRNSFLGILSEISPSMFKYVEATEHGNNFKFNLNIPDTELLSKTFELPFMTDNETSISGYYNDDLGRFSVMGDVPAFSIKKILLEDNSFSFEKFGSAAQAQFRTTHITPSGTETDWSIESIAAADTCNIDINWANNENANIFSGNIETTTHFIASEDENIIIDLAVKPSSFTICDSVWNISPATIFAQGKEISIHDFEIGRNNQHLKIDGDISTDIEKELNLNLKQIDLSFIFDVLNRKNIVFGGEATGDVYVKEIYRGGVPILRTKDLFVKQFSYNKCVFGDLDVVSYWDDMEKAICFNGDVSQPDTEITKVFGMVMPTRDSLFFHFDAHKVNIGFIQPFTEKIMSGVSGIVSGKVDFFGRFKALNVVADAYAEDFSFGIDYLNTRFSITDSVKLDTEGVWANNITIRDSEGHTGKVNMALRHKNFRDMSYDIKMFDIKNFLVFNVTEKQSPVYYGKVYGTGGGQIYGSGNKTYIDVNMATNDNSNFTFVLRDEEVAGDYKFITYIDKDAPKLMDAMVTTERGWDRFNSIKIPEKQHELNINLQIDATRDALMRMVIDPATNDRINAWGEGSIRVEFKTNEPLKIFGTYTVEKGDYSFNLQDIISKEFIVNPGSSIRFSGDPMAADLNVTAYYAVQANLLDLDESFSQEYELNRTTVPVQTTLKLTGNLQVPDIKFDLNFPTLSQNIYRRVKTIINNDDMMNRQVLYLLALNKFYTPEYMSVSERKSNELAAVASSAISSQLNNMLGQISDIVNIGTNFRSDKGDFSDLEFDVILSSQLLNNRLIFNGNLGYRDKSISSNSFIGDFDLEYLINKSGTFRLKAYNHYNDKNYYIKSALTTQGVGIMFKKDFNKASEIFKRNPEDIEANKADKEKRQLRREKRKEKKALKKKGSVN